jgi:hypothetical protein
MMRRTCAQTSLLVLGAWLSVVSDSYAQSTNRSAVVRVCDTARGCIPETTSVVLLYVYDVSGAPIADMPVTTTSPNQARGTVTVRTDRQGMAAISVTPGQSYRLHIDAPGWLPLTTDDKVPTKGAVEALRVVMRVPPIH